MEKNYSSVRPSDSLWIALSGSYLVTIVSAFFLAGPDVLSGEGLLLSLAVLAIVSVVYISCGLALKQNLFFAVPLTILVAVLSTMGWGFYFILNYMFSALSQLTAVERFLIGMPAVGNFVLFLVVVRYALRRRLEARIARSSASTPQR